ncbi:MULTISPECIES: cyclic peptide export ABC transporter [unclassified Coleofasciculus]|uniref:cyclic peptide export ABC transporter n=1 Tax=Cyanophyceae TaxID=3028117 RepID=UPI0016880894|nr:MULTISPECIES: cyclic peptide export ABC transporter [unclassified Coleofasciculus]MBD1887755.1 cyclic peptide export ABC transporter [Coleofasciculus sp. FACHB-SPT9]MBD2084735.1 cyclic peptide export ABC transporter [Coleofasciculus sp. FACHB-542]
MKLIRLLLKNSWVTVILAALTGLLSGGSSAGLIALINLTLRDIQLPTTTLAWSFVSLCFLLFVTMTASQVLIARLAEEVIFNLRMLLNQRILACPLRHLEEIGSSRLLATLTEDIEVISSASISVSGLFVNLAILVGCLLYLSWLSVPLFFFILGFMALGILSHTLLVTKGRDSFKLSREVRDRLYEHFRTTTEGTKELKLHHSRRQAFLSQDLQAAAASSRHYRVAAMSIFAFAGSWGLLLFFVPIGLLIFGLPLLRNIPVSVLSGYALTIVFMITPLRGILNTLPDLSRANVALDKIESLGLSLVAQRTEEHLTTTLDSQFEWSSLKLVGVTHAYRGEREEHRFILGPLDVTFHRGELVFIVGGNGSGKSTLVKLLVGLYIPESGEIQFDGKAITDKNREWYRQQFSVVFSDFYLFNRLLGLDTPSLTDQNQKYLEKLELDRKVQVKDGILSTTALSQGQRKRLALLTAYLEDRPIYIFDEWASDQDPVFKEVFYTQLLPELKSRGKTVLVVSHDDRYFEVADRIVKLDYGKVQYDKNLHR